MDLPASASASTAASDSAAAGASSKLPSQSNNPALTNARNLHFSFTNVRPAPQSRSHAHPATREAMKPPSNGPLVQRRQSLKRKIEDVHPDTRRKAADQRSLSQSQQRTSISQLSRQLGLGLKALSQSNASSSSQKISQRQQLSTQRTAQSQQQLTLPNAADTVPYFQRPSEIARSLHVVPSQQLGQPIATDASPKYRKPSGTVMTMAKNLSYQRPSEITQSPHYDSSQPLSRTTTSFTGPRYQRVSKVASSLVIPKQTIAATLSHSKKHSFTPPLVIGGYAERLLNLMTHQASEYSEWANTTMRKEQTFGAPKPLATVVVIHISRSHGLQWCQCKVINSCSNQPPFDVGQTRGCPGSIVDVGSSPRYECSGSSAPCASSELIARAETTWPSKQTGGSVSADTPMSQEDTIFGLHKEMHSLHVISSQGSVFGHTIDGLLSQRKPHEQSLQQPDPHPDSSVRYLKSSQGSEDEYEDIDGYIGHERTSLQADVILNRTVKAKGAQNSVEEIEDIENCDPESATDIPIATSNISCIDDKLSYYGTYAAPVPQEVSQQAAQLEELSKKTFTIIFSNLFNWSTLKVLDRVEIHDPCRSLTLPKNKNHSGNDSLWIVERYKVL